MSLPKLLICLSTLLSVSQPSWSSKEKWTQKVFPQDGGVMESVESTEKAEKPWKGRWFPREPAQSTEDVKPHAKKLKRPDLIPMGVVDPICDDGNTSLATDFDPFDVRFREVMLCIRPYALYKPNTHTKAHFREYKLPKDMEFRHVCMNETIQYPYDIPTFGNHRKLWAQWGEYEYLPPQRWIHNLEHGGIVLLYHPCALNSEVERLKVIVSSCIYRHIITPFHGLNETRPIALLAWGHSLEMSVVSDAMAVTFIRKYALRGKEDISDNGQYGHLLTKNASVISDIHDSKLCPYYFMLNNTNVDLL